MYVAFSDIKPIGFVSFKTS